MKITGAHFHKQIMLWSGGNQVHYSKIFFGTFDILEAVNNYFAPCLYTALWISAYTEVSREISGSALSAAVEFQVDVSWDFKSKKSAVSKIEFIYPVSTASHILPTITINAILSTANTPKYCFSQYIFDKVEWSWPNSRAKCNASCRPHSTFRCKSSLV